MATNGFNRAGCGEPHRVPGIVPRPPGAPEDYSGFLIIRLAAHVLPTEGTALQEVAKKEELRGLLAVLDEYELTRSQRLVRSLPPESVQRLEEEATRTDLPPLHSLNAYWRVDLRDRPERFDEILKRLNALREVDRAYRELAVSDPQVNTADDTYAADQDYLDAAPVGIDARWAWTQPNGEGAGVAFVDLEQGWRPTHEDLAGKGPTLLYGDNRDGVGTYRGNHGTAVLGEVIAEDNVLGVVGIAPGVSSVRLVSHYDAATNTALHVADGIVAAIPQMGPGEVLLLEVQRNLLPTETDDADFDAARLASAHGIIMVEAAGNGGMDLDAYTDGSGNRILNRGDPAFRESGAVMVGAAESPTPHDRATFSNYGSRIDCYGWGEDVVTCGYGDLDGGGGNIDRTYTRSFTGTSSASPIVAGAALLLQGVYEGGTGNRLSPGQMRVLLSNPGTGTAQGPNRAGAIGVMPNLRAIIQNTLGLVPDIYLRDQVGDSGLVPSAGAISASPDIIVQRAPVADPDASFGEGSGTENSAALGFEVEAGQDNYIYVRMRNRGTSDAQGVTATVYWSEVATLVTPDMWQLIGTTAPQDVPQGDTLVATDPLVWPKGGIPATGHYCFIGVLNHPQDPAPPLPGPTDWSGFTGLIRDQNNVTWRNFNVVDNLPDPSADPMALEFRIVGAPDRARRFDFEILQRLPHGAQLWLELPLGLSSKVTEGRLWRMEIDRERQLARIQLPTEPRTPVCGVRLAASVKLQARFLVRGPERRVGSGHSLAVRQLFEGIEVGRVTWQFGGRPQEKRSRN